MQVIFLEELQQDPLKTLEDIFDFIGLDFLNKGEGAKVSSSTT